MLNKVHVRLKLPDDAETEIDDLFSFWLFKFHIVINNSNEQ